MMRLQVSGNFTDDLPENHEIFPNIRWFEKEFGGMIPIEISINTKKPKHVENYSFLKKIKQFDDNLKNNPHLSKGISVNNAVMFAKQAYYNGAIEKYSPMTGRERLFLAPYLKVGKDNNNLSGSSMRGYVSDDKSIARIGYLVADLNLIEMENLMVKIKKNLDHVFDPEKYETLITGSSIVFLKGTRFLTYNLVQSILLAVFLISVLMAFLFQSFRMILFAVITNLIPLILTAGFMGWIAVPIKPSTILVFSIAFGISVDDTIHFLAKYKLAIKKSGDNLQTIITTIKEIGASMLFTSVALFLGFIIFVFSDFQGTKALGLLLSFTLLVAMFANLIFLPALLMIRVKNSKKIKQP